MDPTLLARKLKRKKENKDAEGILILPGTFYQSTFQSASPGTLSKACTLYKLSAGIFNSDTKLLVVQLRMQLRSKRGKDTRSVV